MRTESRLAQKRRHELVAVHLMNTSSHRTPSTVQERLILVVRPTTHHLVLLIGFYNLIATRSTLDEALRWTTLAKLTLPLQINFHVQLPRRLQVHPKLLLILLITCYQILKCYCGIGIKDIVDWCFMEHGDAQRVGICHFVN